MAFVLDLEKLADILGNIILTNDTPGGRVRTRVEARKYLSTLGYFALFMERDRALESINKGDNSILGLEFPDTENHKIIYTMPPLEYLKLVNQKISSFPRN